MSAPSAISITPSTRTVSIDVRNPAFYRNPLAAYAALHAQCPAFFWEEQQQWYFAGYDQVNSLLARPPLRPADPACGDPRGTGPAGTQAASGGFRPAGGLFAARARAAGAYAASHAGQPRLRLAPDRTAETGNRSAFPFPHRRLREGWRGRASEDLCRNRAGDGDRPHARRAGGHGAKAARLVAPHGAHVHVQPDD